MAEITFLLLQLLGAVIGLISIFFMVITAIVVGLGEFKRWQDNRKIDKQFAELYASTYDYRKDLTRQHKAEEAANDDTFRRVEEFRRDFE